MKRNFVIALAAGALAVSLVGCGDSKKNDSVDANGLRKNGPTATSTTGAPKPTSTAAAATTTASDTATAKPTAAGAASKTTCAEFKKLDEAAEKALIEQILAENPDSPFAGSPNVALGTAKLVCLASSYADTPVAVAARIVPKTN
ncbi:hypothetical protein [Nocardia arthritidis]|uniref:DUF732 domain-containing protein n=1 Tax=Nocardia arthritidis TaxID=228602 RepID=A0A6G9YSE9_9NOCA|nr:hypothetical protein [Nocardia arthritidis]QIS16239.1 hypothetical protein F5544_42150 [Nocardia arthritidis]